MMKKKVNVIFLFASWNYILRMRVKSAVSQNRVYKTWKQYEDTPKECMLGIKEIISEIKSKK